MSIFLSRLHAERYIYSLEMHAKVIILRMLGPALHIKPYITVAFFQFNGNSLQEVRWRVIGPALHREQSNELASSSGKSSGKSSSGKSRGTASAQDAKEAGDAPESGQIASGSTPLEEATEPAPGKTATWPLPWLTWFAQKLYAQVLPTNPHLSPSKPGCSPI